jgi:hypothetical protein
MDRRRVGDDRVAPSPPVECVPVRYRAGYASGK